MADRYSKNYFIFDFENWLDNLSNKFISVTTCQSSKVSFYCCFNVGICYFNWFIAIF